jgi:mannose-6-phosphate isomerase-like protein (cupin superfamily)
VRVIPASALARFESTRDTRTRLDLLTDSPALKADRIVYHPGDSAARHYHVGSDHLFVVLRGEGVAHIGEESVLLKAGDVIDAPDGVVHWFENPGGREFSFVEYWAPPPTETVWIDEGDV